MERSRDRIITSPTAERMLSRVSPIYDESYVGLWTFEAIGRGYDELWEIVNTFPDQLFPETATWGLVLWERRYGIVTDETIPLEDRRQAVLAARDATNRFTHYHLEAYITSKTGGTARVIDNVGPYTFGVRVEAEKGIAAVDMLDLQAYIMSHKPSHLTCKIMFYTEKSMRVHIGFAVHSGVWSRFLMEGVDFEALKNQRLVDELDASLADEHGSILFE